MRLRLFLAPILIAGYLYAADPELLNLAPPDSQGFAGVNFSPLLLSPLGQFLLAQQDGFFSDTDVNQLMQTAGFDPRRDLQEILIPLRTQQAPSSGPGLILARGTFDIPKILAAAEKSGGTPDSYKGVSIIEQGNHQQALAFPNSTLAIFGDAPDVRAAIDRISAPTSINSALAVLVNQVSLSEDAWVAALGPLEAFVPQPQATQGGPSPLALYQNVQQVSGGIKFGANIVLTAQAVSQTNQQAAMLATVLKGMGLGFSSGPNNFDSAFVEELLKSLSVTSEGTVTKVSLSISENQVEQMIQTSHAQAQHHAAPPPPPPPAQITPGEPAAVPQRIRIGGAVQAAKLSERVEPVYPPLAAQARISGAVRLNVIIGKDGTVQNVTVASGHPLLVPAALEAVKQWIYKPTLLNGQPVEVVTQVEVNFGPNQ